MISTTEQAEDYLFHMKHIYNFTPVRSIKEAILQNNTLTVFDDEVLDEVMMQSALLQKRAAIQIKLDTGMTKIGVLSVAQGIAALPRY